MKRKILLSVLCLVMGVVLVGCSSDNTSENLSSYESSSVEEAVDHEDELDPETSRLLNEKYAQFDYEGIILKDETNIGTSSEEIIEYLEAKLQDIVYNTWYYETDDSEKIEITQFDMNQTKYKLLSYSEEFGVEIRILCDGNIYDISVSEEEQYSDYLGQRVLSMCIWQNEGKGNYYFNYASGLINRIAEEAVYEEPKYGENDEVVEFSDNYLPGLVMGTSLSAYVHYARVFYDQNLGTQVVGVGCTVTNISNQNILFWASNYFSLNNNGIITIAEYTDYDNQTIAPGGSFYTEVIFESPNVSRSSDTLSMTMFVDNAEIILYGYPQNEEEMRKFEGIYLVSSPSFDDIYIITDNGDETYNIIWVNDFFGYLRQYTDVHLDDNNHFTLGNGDFLWDSRNSCIYQYDRYADDYDRDNPIFKTYQGGFG